MILLMLFILQAGLIDKAGSQLINLGAIGIMVVLFGFAIYFLVKYVKSLHQSEKERIIKENEEMNKKVDILYSEIKESQSEYAERLTDLLVKMNELNGHIVVSLNSCTTALNNNALALNNNAIVFGKLIDKL